MSLRSRTARAGLVLVAVAAALAGCGTKLPLPTERRENRLIPTDKSYQIIANWTGMDRVRDVLLTQKYGSQLFILFERPTPDTNSTGAVRLYPLTRKEPIPDTDLRNVGNAVALAAGGDGGGAPLNRVFVLDQGDTCVARANPVTHVCGDTTGEWGLKVSNLFHYWRVREYGLLGGDTISTFTDTSMAFVRGVAADAMGRVYVAGIAIILEPDVSNPRILTRQFESRIYRYERGPRYPGVFPADRRMPGANWHRDTTWTVVEGSGIGSLQNPHGMEWMATASGSAIYISDFDKNWIQKLSDEIPSEGFYQIDGAETGTFFFQAEDVAADEKGFVYVCDTGNKRVLRYGPDKEFVQRVDISATDGQGPLVNPVAIAANDSLVFIADPGNARVLKCRRRN